MNNPLFMLKNLHFSYQSGIMRHTVLNNIQLQIDPGTIVGLKGPSGSGKSTLLNLLGLIEKPQDGELIFRGEPILGLTEERLNIIRRFEIGFIFQDFQLIEILSVEENVAYFLHRQGLHSHIREKRVRESLDLLGLSEHRLKRPHELSGGQKQRVAIARALAKNPKVIIADEPTANLDQKNGLLVLENLKLLNEKKGVNIVIASHDPVVFRYTHQTIHLEDGAIVKETSESEHAA